MGNDSGLDCPILQEDIRTSCVSKLGDFQPLYRIHETCPRIGRPVHVHFFSGTNHEIALVIYCSTRDVVDPNLYIISIDEWEHDSGYNTNSNL